MTIAADLLQGVELFAGVPREHLESLADRATVTFLEAGKWLFHAGDPGDALFVVVHGSIEIVTEGPEPEVLAICARGESTGELELLHGGSRTMGARARRDSELMRIAREDFERLLTTQSSFAVTLVRLLGERLSRARPMAQPKPPLKTISLVPLHDGVPVGEIADALAAELRSFGPVVQLDEVSSTFSRFESANDWVLLAASSAAADDPWTRYCRRQADRVIALATRAGPATPDPAQRELRRCDLAVLAPRGVEPPVERWLDILEPRVVHVLRERSPDSVARMARRLAGRAVGIVLSGGGARGLAHIGIVEELQRCGVAIDRIGGTSFGGMVASLFAEQRSPDEVAAVIEEAYVRDTPLRGRTIPIVSLSRGERGLAKQYEIHGQRRIEGLDIPFFCISSDLVSQAPVVHRRGPVAVAVSATQALPGFVPPVPDGGQAQRLLLDGAIFNNLPVEPMRLTAEGPVIASDVSGRLPPPRPARWRAEALRRWIVGPAADWAPDIAETVLRSILLGNASSDAVARESADVLIQPRLRGIPMLAFHRLDEIREMGREAVRQARERGELDAILGPAPTPPVRTAPA